MRAASKDAEDILTKGGFKNIRIEEVKPTKPGNRIHEMGTARMGRDPSSSVLNKWNQCWDVTLMFSRREFMGGTAAALGLAACGDTGSAVKLGQRKISKVGIQTYTLREIFEPDPKGTLEMIKAAGYDYVELNERNFVSRGAQELKDMLDEVGLPSPATHMNYDAS